MIDHVLSCIDYINTACLISSLSVVNVLESKSVKDELMQEYHFDDPVLVYDVQSYIMEQYRQELSPDDTDSLIQEDASSTVDAARKTSLGLEEYIDRIDNKPQYLDDYDAYKYDFIYHNKQRAAQNKALATILVQINQASQLAKVANNPENVKFANIYKLRRINFDNIKQCHSSADLYNLKTYMLCVLFKNTVSSKNSQFVNFITDTRCMITKNEEGVEYAQFVFKCRLPFLNINKPIFDKCTKIVEYTRERLNCKKSDTAKLNELDMKIKVLEKNVVSSCHATKNSDNPPVYVNNWCDFLDKSCLAPLNPYDQEELKMKKRNCFTFVVGWHAPLDHGAYVADVKQCLNIENDSNISVDQNNNHAGLNMIVSYFDFL